MHCGRRGFWGCGCRVWGSGTLFNIRDAALEEGHADEALKSPRRVGYRAGAAEQGRALRTRCTLITVRRKAAVLRIRSDSRGREGGTDRRREGGREGGREDEKSARVLHREGERERGREGGETEVDKRG